MFRLNRCRHSVAGCNCNRPMGPGLLLSKYKVVFRSLALQLPSCGKRCRARNLEGLHSTRLRPRSSGRPSKTKAYKILVQVGLWQSCRLVHGGVPAIAPFSGKLGGSNTQQGGCSWFQGRFSKGELFSCKREMCPQTKNE